MAKEITLLEAMEKAIENIKNQSPEEYMEKVKRHRNGPIATAIRESGLALEHESEFREKRLKASKKAIQEINSMSNEELKEKLEKSKNSPVAQLIKNAAENSRN